MLSARTYRLARLAILLAAAAYLLYIGFDTAASVTRIENLQQECELTLWAVDSVGRFRQATPWEFNRGHIRTIQFSKELTPDQYRRVLSGMPDTQKFVWKNVAAHADEIRGGIPSRIVDCELFLSEHDPAVIDRLSSCELLDKVSAVGRWCNDEVLLSMKLPPDLRALHVAEATASDQALHVVKRRYPKLRILCDSELISMPD